MHTPESIRAAIGSQIGVSPWTTISQPMINQFADLTGDRQFIHVDPVAAAKGPYGGTIAHGFLTLSMIADFGKSADCSMQGVVMALNYGFDKVRMLSPVRVGAAVRGRFVLKSAELRAPGQWLLCMTVTVDIEGQDRPALVADWLILQHVAG